MHATLTQYRQPLIGGFVGLLVGLVLGSIWFTTWLEDGHFHTHDAPHEIGYSEGDQVHVHADFVVSVNGERLRFTDAEYQATAQNLPHTDLHLHDGVDNVIHRHADGVTFAEFINSLGLTLTDTCLTTKDGTPYCTDDTSALRLFVNTEPVPVITEYIFNEEDQILLYYGNASNQAIIDELLNSITDEACIYSGTCPERGVAPPESCGLTCEL